MLITVSGGGDPAVSELLENVWNCMVLVLGQDELANIRNVERLNQELLLLPDRHERVNDNQGFMGDLTQCADCLLPSHSGLFHEALDSFTKIQDINKCDSKK